MMAAAPAPTATTLDCLHPELLVRIFRMAQLESDEAHIDAYGVRPRSRMPLVCRRFRDAHAKEHDKREDDEGKERRRPVLCVPLLLPDGYTPTFITLNDWRAYFEQCLLLLPPPKPKTTTTTTTKKKAEEEEDSFFFIHLLSSPAGPFNIAAHLDSLSLPDFVMKRIVRQRGGGVDPQYGLGVGGGPPHVRYLPAIWSFWLCGTIMLEMGLTAHIRFLEIRLCLPQAIRHRIESGPYADHVAMWQLPCAMLSEKNTPHLRTVSLRVGIMSALLFSAPSSSSHCHSNNNDHHATTNHNHNNNNNQRGEGGGGEEEERGGGQQHNNNNEEEAEPHPSSLPRQPQEQEQEEEQRTTTTGTTRTRTRTRTRAEEEEEEDARLVQNDIYIQAWQQFAHGLCLRTHPIEELRIGLENRDDPRWNPTDHFDDFILKMMIHASNARRGPMLYMMKTTHGDSWWASTFGGEPHNNGALAEYPIKIRRIVLADHGEWEDRLVYHTLALLCAERVELLGPLTFRPKVDSSLNVADFWHASSHRTTPMALVCRVRPHRPSPEWLTLLPAYDSRRITRRAQQQRRGLSFYEC